MLKATIARILPPRMLAALRQFGPVRQRRVERSYRRAVTELEAAARERFPSLPPREGRAELLMELSGTAPTEALNLLSEMHRALPAGGDVCEFGVAEGTTSALLANDLHATDRDLWLFDSFEGLPKPGKKDVMLDDIFDLGAIERYEGTMRFGEREVRRRIAATGFASERLHVVRGVIERATTFPERIAFAYIDFDFYEPVATAMRICDERMPSGGGMVIDDYGFFTAGAQAAVDEFLAAHGRAYEAVRPKPWEGEFIMLRKR